jgi:hypothetical protein
MVAALVAVGGVTFAVGRATAPAAASAVDAAGTGRRGAGSQGTADTRSPGTGNRNTGGGAGTRLISGTVKGTDGSTLTITTVDGTDVVIDVSAADYHAQSPATAADVTAGSSVAVAVAGSGRTRQDTNGTSRQSPAGNPGAARASDVTIVSTP